MFPMTLADYRKLAGVTQAEMAMHMGVPFRTYQDIEAGKVSFRDLHANAARWALIKIAVAKEDASMFPEGIAEVVAAAAALLGSGSPPAR